MDFLEISHLGVQKLKCTIARIRSTGCDPGNFMQCEFIESRMRADKHHQGLHYFVSSFKLERILSKSFLA